MYTLQGKVIFRIWTRCFTPKSIEGKGRAIVIPLHVVTLPIEPLVTKWVITFMYNWLTPNEILFIEGHYRT